jgi:hypothetical protein
MVNQTVETAFFTTEAQRAQRMLSFCLPGDGGKQKFSIHLDNEY